MGQDKCYCLKKTQGRGNALNEWGMSGREWGRGTLSCLATCLMSRGNGRNRNGGGVAALEESHWGRGRGIGGIALGEESHWGRGRFRVGRLRPPRDSVLKRSRAADNSPVRATLPNAPSTRLAPRSLSKSCTVLVGSPTHPLRNCSLSGTV